MDRIYVIGTREGPYKVGYSSSPAQRLSSIQTAYPHPLSIVASAETASPRAAEKALHLSLKPYRLAGEWFACDLAVILSEMSDLGLAPSVRRAESEEYWMQPEVFEAWMLEMAKPPFFASDAECARLLGISANGLLKMKKQGTTRQTALACRALLHRMTPYGE